MGPATCTSIRRLRFELLEDRRLLATITVNTVVDENDGVVLGGVSLRDAIVAATAGDTIDFDAALTSGGPAAILLAHGELLVDKSLTITGPGAALLTIDAQQDSRVFNIDNGNFGYLQEVALQGLTITGGRVTIAPATANGGGGIRSVAHLTLADSVVTGNTVIGDQDAAGGGILVASQWASGPSTITNTTISGNSASGDGGGMCIWSSFPETVDDCIISDNVSGANGGGVSGPATITGSTISGNSAVNGGGGVDAFLIRDSTISGNTASLDGGGVWRSHVDNCSITQNWAGRDGGGAFGYSTLFTVSNSTISDNTASGNGGGVSAASVDRCTISHNTAGGDGGGIHNGSVTNSTIIDNTADNGGGIADCGTVTNSTIARNTAAVGGGVYENDGSAITIRHSTITENNATAVGGGIYAGGSAAPLIRHTILAGNSAPANPDVSFPAATPSLVYNLIGDNSGTTLVPAPVGMPDANGNLIGTAAEPIDPSLGPLADNGGPTLTYALLIGSPAIDAGDPAARLGEGSGSSAVPFYDQRGEPFLRVREIPSTRPIAIDIGAYEVPGIVRGDYNGNGIGDAADYVVWRKTDGQTGVPPSSGADGNGDGNIDNADYGVWHTSFGGTELVQTNVIVGTLEDDDLVGTEGDDWIYCFAGNDIVNAGDGNDTVDGGVGHDVLNGDGGNDLILGGTGNETINGGTGNDTMEGGLGNDRCYFTSPDFGHDIVTDTGGVSDRLAFTTFNVPALGFYGFYGMDVDNDGSFDSLQIRAGDNDNTVTINNFFDDTASDLGLLSDANRGAGFIEFLQFQDGTSITDINNELKPLLQDGRGPNQINGTSGDDDLVGTDRDDFIQALAGEDVVQAGIGDDTIDGGAGHDLLFGEAGNDLILGGTGSGSDTLDGGTGDDTLEGGFGNDYYRVSSLDFGHDILTDSAGLTDRIVFEAFNASGVEFYGMDTDNDGNFDSLQIRHADNTVTINNFFDDTASDLGSLSDANRGVGFIERIEFLDGAIITDINSGLKPLLQDGRTPGAGSALIPSSLDRVHGQQVLPVPGVESSHDAVTATMLPMHLAAGFSITNVAVLQPPTRPEAVRRVVGSLRSDHTAPRDAPLVAWLSERGGGRPAEFATPPTVDGGEPPTPGEAAANTRVLRTDAADAVFGLEFDDGL